MNGTEWTEPGHGSTLHDLVCAALDEIDAGHLKHPGTISRELARHPERADKRTNLRLTGSPLTAEDLKRIAEAK